MAITSISNLSRKAGSEPDMKALNGDWMRCVNDRDTNYWQRQKLNWETRYCRWANQTMDGRKWQKKGSPKVWPWNGSADSRVPLVDKYVREDVALLMQIWSDMRIMVRPNTPAKDAAWASRLTSMLRWLVYEEMAETEDEAEYLANLFLERGSGALGIWWDRQETMIRETVSMDQILQASQQAQMRMAQGEQGDALMFQAQMPTIILDPSMESQAVEILTGLAGEENAMEPKRIKKMLKDLRESGEAKFPRPVLSKNRPCIRALAWNEDIWTPPEATWDLQSSRQIFIRELLTESQVRERAASYDWDPKYTDKALETQQGMVTKLFETSKTKQYNWNSLGIPDETYLYEVICAYERLNDDDGVPGIYATTFLPGMPTEDGFATSELLDYAHGQYPFVSCQTERRSRCMDDARGYGEVASTFQTQIKRQWDARIDRTDIATLPPSHHPPGEEPDAWGPGVQIPTMQSDKYGYFDTPEPDAGSKEVEETVRKFSDEYFGRPVDEQNQVEAQLLKRELSRKWLRTWKLAHTQILQLCQQYMPDEFFFRVVGGEQGRGIKATREEIQGPFNVTLKFNVRDIDPEFVQPRIEMMEKVLSMDANAIVDRNEAIAAAMELVDPSYAERLLRPADASARQEAQEEQDVLAKLLQGIEVDVKGNEAFALRKQVLVQSIQNNPTAQRAMQDPHVAETVKRRLKQIEFNINQRFVNPEIGRRLGTKPSEQLTQPQPY